MKKKSLVSICISVCATLVACSMMLSGCTTEKHRHDYGKWKITVEPTCTQEGEKIRSCDCGATKTRKIPVTGRHVYGEDNLCAECGIEIEYTQELLYEENFDGTGITITGLDEGAPSNVIIPRELDGLPVTRIEEYAFANHSEITSIAIPDSVTEIGAGAFNGCEGLTSITIPEGVTIIDECTFENCSGLELVVIPDSVESIGEGAFYGCENLFTVYYKGSPVDWINILIEDYNDSLNYGAVSYYSESTPVDEGFFWHYDNGVPTDWPMHEHIFVNDVCSGCGYTENDCEELDYSINYYLGTVSITGLADWSVTDVVIPKYICGYKVTSIDWYAFCHNDQLTSVTIPNSIPEISASMFYGCSGLVSITIPNGVTKIGNEAFYGCSSLASVTIPDSVTQIGTDAFSGCTNLTSVTIGNGVEEIKDYTFSGCTNLTSVNLGDNMRSIGFYAFYCCESITSINIPDTVTIIDQGAFFGCLNLTSIIIPDSVTSIGQCAFMDCTSLYSVTIGAGVTIIDYGAFDECTGISKVYYKGTKSDWNEITISINNDNLTARTRYYYSESKPTASGNYWRFVNGVPRAW